MRTALDRLDFNGEIEEILKEPEYEQRGSGRRFLNDFRAATSQRFFSDRERPTSRTERMGDSESKETFRRSWSRDSPSSREGFGGRGDSAQARADRFRRSLRNHQDGQQRSDDPALSQNAFAALGALDAALPDHAMAKNPSRREGAAEAKPRGLQNTSR